MTQLSERLARIGSPTLFARSASSTDSHPWRLAPHLALINDALLDVAWTGGQRLLVNLPPRHGKSLLISNYFPAWLVGSFPERRVILASYAAEIAQSWGAAARDLLLEHGPLYGVNVRSDSARRGRWETPEGGGMLATGVGGQITGYGADVFIIDDPVKGPVESQSEVQQQRIWDWYRSVAYSRLQPGASIICCQTRWHESDLTGRLLAEDPGGWRQIVLPALAQDDDPLGREPGAALWPEMFDEATLAETRRVQSDYWWNALYQQSPSPPGGACFHRSWYRHHVVTQDAAYQVEPTLDDPAPRPVPIRECRRYVTVDTASSQRTSADYTVLATWDAHPPTGRLFLVDIIRDRLEAPDILPRARRLYDALHPAYFMVEREFIGLSVVQELKRDALPVREMSARGLGDKWTRSQDAASKMKAGMISWPAHLSVFEEELAMFPYGAHDDQVDALAYAAIHQSQLGSGRATLVSAADVRIPTRGEALSGF